MRSPSGSPGGQAAISRSSNPTSRSPRAVASGEIRLAAPPIAQPLSSENGEVIDSTSPTILAITASESVGRRWERQYAWVPRGALPSRRVWTAR